MVCREYKESLSSYLDDEVKPLERLRVEAHLRGCGRCRRHLRQIRHARELLGRLERLQAPGFAVRRARSIAIGDRARGWERLRGGLTPRPQQIPLKPVFMVGLAFLMILVVAKNFSGLNAPATPDSPHAGEATPGEATHAPPENGGRLPGTMAPDQLTDGQKAGIALSVLKARAKEAPAADAEASLPLDEHAPVEHSPVMTGATASAEPARGQEADETLDGPLGIGGESVTRIAEFEGGPPERDPIPGVLAGPSGPANDSVQDPDRRDTQGGDEERRVWPEDRDLVGDPVAAAPVVVLLRTAPTAEAGGPATDVEPGATGLTPTGLPEPSDAAAEPEILDLETSYTQVLVLSKQENGSVTAAFHSPQTDRAGGMLTMDRDTASEVGTLQGEARSEALARLLEELPPARTDPDTGVAPPLPLLLPAPELGGQDLTAFEQEFLGPVALRVLVEPDGSVGQVASVSDSGLPWLDRAVQRAVRTWTFRPAEADGEPVAAVVEVVVEFEQE